MHSFSTPLKHQKTLRHLINITFLSKQPDNCLISDKLQMLVNYSGNFSLWSLDSYSNISIMTGPFVFSALRNATKNNLMNQFVPDYHKVFSLKETFPCNDYLLVTFITFFYALYYGLKKPDSCLFQ